MMKSRFLNWTIVIVFLLIGCIPSQKNGNESIRAYNIDFNWGGGGPNGFARPRLWADASPSDHVNWYASLGCNVIKIILYS